MASLSDSLFNESFSIIPFLNLFPVISYSLHVRAVELYQNWERELVSWRESYQVWDLLSSSLRACPSGSAEPLGDIKTTVYRTLTVPLPLKESSGESSHGMLMLQSKSGQWKFGTVFQKGDIVSLLWDPLACQAALHSLSSSFQRDRRDFETCEMKVRCLLHYRLIRKMTNRAEMEICGLKVLE